MKKLRSSIGYFAATGCAASYTDLLDPTAFYDKLEYLNLNFQWARVAYGSKYLAALSQE